MGNPMTTRLMYGITLPDEEIEPRFLKCNYCKNLAFIGVELFAGEIIPMCKKHYDDYNKDKKSNKAFNRNCSEKPSQSG